MVIVWIWFSLVRLLGFCFLLGCLYFKFKSVLNLFVYEGVEHRDWNQLALCFVFNVVSLS